MLMSNDTTHAVGRARLLASTLDCATGSTGVATTMWQATFGVNHGAMKPSIGGSARHLATETT